MGITYNYNMTETKTEAENEEVQITAIDVHAAYDHDENERIDHYDNIPENAEYVEVWFSTGYSVKYTLDRHGDVQVNYKQPDKYHRQVHDSETITDVRLDAVVKEELDFITSGLEQEIPPESVSRTVGLEDSR